MALSFLPGGPCKSIVTRISARAGKMGGRLTSIFVGTMWRTRRRRRRWQGPFPGSGTSLAIGDEHRSYATSRIILPSGPRVNSQIRPIMHQLLRNWRRVKLHTQAFICCPAPFGKAEHLADTPILREVRRNLRSAPHLKNIEPIENSLQQHLTRIRLTNSTICGTIENRRHSRCPRVAASGAP
jgi:hypothetical protein